MNEVKPDVTPVASVIVRAKDKVGTIEATLRALREQTVPLEIIVVDSGSTDGTLEVARSYADLVVEIPAAEFSYGGTLNLGASHASAPFHFAVSAHSLPTDESWAERHLRHYVNPRVAATNGLHHDIHGHAAADHTVYVQTVADIESSPEWGFSNHASCWRAEVWQRFPFNETLKASEDKEWSWRVLRAGYDIVYDSDITIPSVHRRKEGLKRLYYRNINEAEAMALLLDRPRPSVRAHVARWWTDFPYASRKPLWVRRASPQRAAEYLGMFMGERAAARPKTSR